MPTQTLDQWIEDWGRGESLRYSIEADLEALPVVGSPIVEAPPEFVSLCERQNSGIGVQLLLQPYSGKTFVTVVWGSRDETFEVSPADALEAFYHPFVYGCTLREERVVARYDELQHRADQLNEEEATA